MQLGPIINSIPIIENGEIYACCVSGDRYSAHLLRIIKLDTPTNSAYPHIYGFVHEHGFSLFDYYGSLHYVPTHLSTGIELLSPDNTNISFRYTRLEDNNDNVTVFIKDVPTASANLELQPMFFDREGYFLHFDEARAFCLAQLIKKQKMLTDTISHFNACEPDLMLMAVL